MIHIRQAHGVPERLGFRSERFLEGNRHNDVHGARLNAQSSPRSGPNRNSVELPRSKENGLRSSLSCCITRLLNLAKCLNIGARPLRPEERLRRSRKWKSRSTLLGRSLTRGFGRERITGREDSWTS